MARKVPSINTSSSADISFLLLTFFLLTSNISTDQGILRTLPKWSSNTKQEDVEINTRNLLTVTVNGKNDVIISGAKWSGDNWLVLTDERKHINSTNASNYGGEIDMLHEIAKEFFGNPNNDLNLPETHKEVISEANFGEYEVSNGVISLKCNNGASYETYIKVHNQLSMAVNALRENLSKERFSKSYKALEEGTSNQDKEKVKAIRKAIPMNISESSTNK